MNKLKQIVILLVFLSFFVITNKVSACYIDPETGIVFREVDYGYKKNKNIKRVPREDIKENDMEWLISADCETYLSLSYLRNLTGLEKHVNFSQHRPGIGDRTILHRVLKSRFEIDNDKLEIIKFLVSIGANVDDKALDIAVENLRSICCRLSARMNRIQPNEWHEEGNKKASLADEIKQFLLEEKEKQKKLKAEKEKITMGKNFLEPNKGKFYDVRFYLQGK